MEIEKISTKINNILDKSSIKEYLSNFENSELKENINDFDNKTQELIKEYIDSIENDKKEKDISNKEINDLKGTLFKEELEKQKSFSKELKNYLNNQEEDLSWLN